MSMLAIVLLVFFLAGCGNQTTTLTKADVGKTIQLHSGDQIVIQLDENPSTGYEWGIEMNNASILTLQSSTYTASGNLPGSGGTRVFTFQANNPGTGLLLLRYWRKAEGDSSIINRFNVNVQVLS
jgi:inhibitor of cysteine peptidase